MEKTFNILLMHVHGRRPAVAMHCERVIAQETINLRQFITFLAQPGERELWPQTRRHCRPRLWDAIKLPEIASQRDFCWDWAGSEDEQWFRFNPLKLKVSTSLTLELD